MTVPKRHHPQVGEACAMTILLVFPAPTSTHVQLCAYGPLLVWEGRTISERLPSLTSVGSNTRPTTNRTSTHPDTATFQIGLTAMMTMTQLRTTATPIPATRQCDTSQIQTGIETAAMSTIDEGNDSDVGLYQSKQ
jgi:hypothetical protein